MNPNSLKLLINYLPLEISFLPIKPKKGPWFACSSFFCLKYSWSSLAFCLWNSMVITFLPSTATCLSGALGGDGGGGEEVEGGDGGVGLRGVGGCTIGLLKGPSAWELLMVSVVENLKL